MSEDLLSQTRLGKQEVGERGVQETRNGECSRGLEVLFGDYTTIEKAECSGVTALFGGRASPSVSNTNVNEQKQFLSGQL